MNNQGIAGYPPSPYIVNLIELQNTINSATGVTPLNVVSNAVTNIQKMVDFDQKRIYTNIISQYNQTPIQVTDNLNLSNANLFINGTEVTGLGGGGSASGTVISTTGGNGIFVTSTTNVSSVVIGFQVAGRTVFSFDALGRALYYDPSGTGNRFWVSNATLLADKLQVGGSVFSNLTTSTPFNVQGNGVIQSTLSSYTLAVFSGGSFGGNVTGPAFITPSDRRLKMDISPISSPEQIVSSLSGVRFKWIHSGKSDIGFVAQDVQSALPEAVSKEHTDTLHIAYDRIIPVLVEAVKDLTGRVIRLEKEIVQLKKQGNPNNDC
jgi:hypothetical protein